MKEEPSDHKKTMEKVVKMREHWRVSEIVDFLGISRSQIYAYLSVSQLPKDIIEDWDSKKITFNTVSFLARRHVTFAQKAIERLRTTKGFHEGDIPERKALQIIKALTQELLKRAKMPAPISKEFDPSPPCSDDDPDQWESIGFNEPLNSFRGNNPAEITYAYITNKDTSLKKLSFSISPSLARNAELGMESRLADMLINKHFLKFIFGSEGRIGIQEHKNTHHRSVYRISPTVTQKLAPYFPETGLRSALLVSAVSPNQIIIKLPRP